VPWARAGYEIPRRPKRVSRVANRDQLRVGDLVVNTLSKQVTVGGTVVPRSVKEFQLLATLAANPERVFSKRELLEMVWEFKSHGRTRTLDSHANRRVACREATSQRGCRNSRPPRTRACPAHWSSGDDQPATRLVPASLGRERPESHGSVGAVGGVTTPVAEGRVA